MQKLALLILLSTILITGCGQKSVTEKPNGYLNNTTLKIAYALGTLKLIDAEFPLPTAIQETKDIIYKTINGQDLKLDIYQEKNNSKLKPLIIFIHGGAWKKGDKQDYWPYLIPYAEKGYVTASIQYRFTGVAKYPAQINDVEDAILWLTKNAATYYIDPNKIALVGGSAGAHLALLAAYSKPELNIKGIVNLYGPNDLTTDYAINAASVKSLIGQSYKDAPELYNNASPINYISSSIPPTLTFQGTLDELVPYSQSDNLDKKIKEAGATSYYHKLKGWPHTMDASVKVNAYCRHYMDEFFETYISKE
jgi:acetyl esterase/lipase